MVSAVVVESLVLLAYYWRFSYPKLLGLAGIAMMVAGFVNIQLRAYYLNSREFDDYPAYNSDFIRCNPNTDIFAVTDDDQFVCNFYFDLKAMRPLPLISTPGLMDHVYGEYVS